MPRSPRAAHGKQDFATRLAPETLAQLDTLVQRGRFKNRTAVIEAAVGRLFEAEQRDVERKREAFERSCGVLDLGTDREAWRRAELDRLEFEGRTR